MNYYSLHHKAADAGFKQAVIQGLAADRGLYFPKEITPLDPEFIASIETYSNTEIAYKVIEQFVGDAIEKKALKQIIEDTLCFDFPVVPIEKDVYALELFHGPTMAFKDVGARFMARCLQYFNKQDNAKDVTVLVATSGDTGGAVASGFLGVKGVKVVILYPSKKVSDIQERQLTTLGQNITALEVAGTFDDCQDMVKTAFLDPELQACNLTSANSINIARWLPQMFYFFFAYKQLKQTGKKPVFSVPSGNFGNICAAVMASKLGLPIAHFIAATNSNDTVGVYLNSGVYTPKPSKATISNAMDVGNPSNFIRIEELFENNLEALKKEFSSYSYSDAETKKAMQHIFNINGYVADPHGAIGYLGLKKYQETHPDALGVFLETAHPIKFSDIVEQTLGNSLEIPKQIQSVLDKEKKKIFTTSYKDLKEYLLS